MVQAFRMEIQPKKCAENVNRKTKTEIEIAGICSFFFWFSFPLFSSCLLYFVLPSRWISCLPSCRKIRPRTPISCFPFSAETPLEDGTNPAETCFGCCRNSPVRERGRRKLLSILPWFSPSVSCPIWHVYPAYTNPWQPPYSAHTLTAETFPKIIMKLDGVIQLGLFWIPTKLLIVTHIIIES